MGPRRCGRGKNPINAALCNANPLQWGRDAVVAERRMRELDAALEKSLQWGRDAVVAESGGRMGS